MLGHTYLAEEISCHRTTDLWLVVAVTYIVSYQVLSCLRPVLGLEKALKLLIIVDIAPVGHPPMVIHLPKRLVNDIPVLDPSVTSVFF